MIRIFFFSCLIACAATAADKRLEKLTFRSPTAGTLLYQAHIPSDLPATAKVPVVLFLHGAGERGKDNEKQSVHGVPQILDFLEKNNLPAILLAPQCPKGQQWVNTPWGAKSHSMPEKPSDAMQLALDLLAQTIKNHPVDESRVYVVGLSMGGYGTWDAIQRKPTLFAAAVPVCGGADTALAPKIAQVPIWTWHGDKDNVVPTSRSRDIVAALKAAGGTPKYTELPGVGHNSWSAAFKSNELLSWLFEQRKK